MKKPLDRFLEMFETRFGGKVAEWYRSASTTKEERRLLLRTWIPKSLLSILTSQPGRDLKTVNKLWNERCKEGLMGWQGWLLEHFLPSDLGVYNRQLAANPLALRFVEGTGGNVEVFTDADNRGSRFGVLRSEEVPRRIWSMENVEWLDRSH